MAAGKGADLGKLQKELSELDPRYTLTKIIGAGSYGVVAKAVDNTDQEQQYDPQGKVSGTAPRPVAVKKISSVIFRDMRLAKRILREVKLLAHFHEKNIGEDKAQYIIGLRNLVTPPTPKFDTFWIIMELADSDMKSVLRSGQTLSLPQVQYMLYEMFHGLNTMKACKVIHRDITPANVLVNYANLAIKICDFGLAREEPKDDDPYMTDYVTMRWYRAPELVMESKTYTEQVDIWGIGCIFGEMLGWGKPMFRGADRINQLDKIVEICGSPSAEELQQIGSEAAQKYVGGRYIGPTCKKGEKKRCDFKEQSQYEKHAGLEDGRIALDLLDKMLHFNPNTRITVEAALEHPFITKYSKDPRYAKSLDTSSLPVFDFSDEKLDNLQQVKDALFQETVAFHKKNPDTMTEQQAVAMQTEGLAEAAAAGVGEERTGFEGTVDAGDCRMIEDTEFRTHGGAELPGPVEGIVDALCSLADEHGPQTAAAVAAQINQRVKELHDSPAGKRLMPLLELVGWDGDRFNPEPSKRQCLQLVKSIREAF
eukprot:TRINITY_DN5495_c0_g1_i2.p1 TRINITY_DN5495_c0_g1~~TRINITY_DN5495_c0_g1_i2.p1  ORF type:complete len:571 (+),score=211.95 TRINITY_DN5495_c0_g1_i2:100-1713(+)